jgi:hypothetical protein
MSVITKTTAPLDTSDGGWIEVLENTVAETDTIVTSGFYGGEVHVVLAIGEAAVAHTGTQVLVQVSSNSSGDEDWTNLATFISASGTAVSEAPSVAVSATDTVIQVASTTGFEDDGVKWIFFKDDTLADSEVCLLVSHEGTPSLTMQDGVTNAHGTGTSAMFDIVDVFPPVLLPFGCMRVRVIFDNTYDNNGANVYGYGRITEVTSVS